LVARHLFACSLANSYPSAASIESSGSETDCHISHMLQHNRLSTGAKAQIISDGT
jgi:hypothetical protein